MSVPISRLIVLKDRLQSPDDAVLKKTLKELDRVEMTVDMLKESGIGVAVNQLRHHDTFASVARQLVTRWKRLAAARESSSSSDGFASSRKNHSSSSTKRSHVSNSGRRSPSPSSSPISKKQKLDISRCSKSESKSSSTKAKPSRVNLASHGDGDEGNFTAESGSFEQILGLNDSAQRYASPSAKSHHSDHRKQTKRTTNRSKYDDCVLANGDEKRSSKKQRAIGSEYDSKTTNSSLSVDWSKVLPTKLATEYRPQPRSAVIEYDDDRRRHDKNGADSDPDGLDFSQMKKNKLTKIYSGRRNIFLQHVPTLFESCIHVLRDNIDALGYTGGVPFDILKPVLERATAAQLYRIEEWNPYLLEDTSDLWKGHCHREFKNAEPDWEEGETWRELYERMLAERDKKLNKLKQVISEQKAAKDSAVRQAKMALAKAPREVRRRQMKYGTFRKETHIPDPDEIVQSRRNLDSNPGANTSHASRAFSHIYEEEQKQKEQPKNRKEKIAPLMAKSLKMMKLARSRN